MNVPIHGTPKACEVFEMCHPLDGDKIYFDGMRNANIIRHGHRWPMWLMPIAMNYQMMSYPEPARAGLARIKPIQSSWSGGYLALDDILQSQESMRFPPGPTTLLSEDEVRLWMENCDLMRTCDFGSNEWRAIRPIKKLRQIYK
ncbi:hypothetical protein [Polaromonas naphthalenivorans]|uniref:Uncharacterized protein n=1 Tax=Polaromonas naphthalenivorans (strain CJ2) TaxID=365044 RepID=A1VV47_POLNA|nr:hypothetical protein [Polaromonas naphthalenivorans]ABM39525.1 hypothetical protein Pnap_4242 [Polaromonas naphthalenivorans CJ2]